MSTQKQHTPGPWRVESFDGPRQYAEVVAGTESFETFRICDIPSWPCAAEEMEANARLIAAAPELLEALENAVQFHHGARGLRRECDNIGWVRVARAAIAKATGNP